MRCADYEDIAELLGCRPTLSRLLRERPTALWHAYLTSWQPLHYRLVGPGRLENAEAQLEALYESRHYGTYKSSGRGYDALPEGLEGQAKPGDPRKLQGPFWWVGVAQSWWKMWRRLQAMKRDGVPLAPLRLQDHLEANLEFARADAEEKGIVHSLAMHEEPAGDAEARRAVFGGSGRNAVAEAEAALE